MGEKVSRKKQTPVRRNGHQLPNFKQTWPAWSAISGTRDFVRDLVWDWRKRDKINKKSALQLHKKFNTMKFTIVTVCRNEAGGIRRTIESICSQTFQKFEWFVIDGGSTDGTVNELTKVKDRISTFISEEDSGVYNAMNKGLKHATGSYVIFMNGGDAFYDQNSLNVYNEHIGPDILYGNLLFTGASERLKTYPSEIKKTIFSRELSLIRLVQS